MSIATSACASAACPRLRLCPEGSKRSLNVSIDFADDNQRVQGYRTLNLLNANSDPTFVRALLYSHIARQYVPAARINYVRVVINGESWGVYLNAEQFNSDFVRDRFKDKGGARWKVPGSPIGRGGMAYLGENIDAYRGIYDIKSRDTEQSWRRLIQMFKVLNETPADRLEAELAPLLDIDGALKFLALDVALANTDGYWTRASDYNIYLDAQGRVHVLPHDMNEGLEDEGGGPGPAGRARRAARRTCPSSYHPAFSCRPDFSFRQPSVRPAPSSIRWSVSTMRASRCDRSCWRCRRCARSISATCARSPTSGSTGGRSSRWFGSISR